MVSKRGTHKRKLSVGLTDEEYEKLEPLLDDPWKNPKRLKLRNMKYRRSDTINENTSKRDAAQAEKKATIMQDRDSLQSLLNDGTLGERKHKSCNPSVIGGNSRIDPILIYSDSDDDSTHNIKVLEKPYQNFLPVEMFTELGSCSDNAYNKDNIVQLDFDTTFREDLNVFNSHGFDMLQENILQNTGTKIKDPLDETLTWITTDDSFLNEVVGAKMTESVDDQLSLRTPGEFSNEAFGNNVSFTKEGESFTKVMENKLPLAGSDKNDETDIDISEFFSEDFFRSCNGEA